MGIEVRRAGLFHVLQLAVALFHRIAARADRAVFSLDVIGGLLGGLAHDLKTYAPAPCS